MIQIIVKINNNEIAAKFEDNETAVDFVNKLLKVKTKKNPDYEKLDRALKEVKNFKRSDAVSLETALSHVGN
jgi:hypothetical protein